MTNQSVHHLLVYGADRAGPAIQWLTGWPVTREAAVILTPGSEAILLVQFYNHVPNAREIALAEVRWGGVSTISSAIEILLHRMSSDQRLGIIGPLPYSQFSLVRKAVPNTIDLSDAYIQMRIVKSPEEIDWFRLGAQLSDKSIDALCREIRPGLSERELAAIVECAYLPFGGANLIHFFGLTSMANPDRCVPAQFPSTRRVATGDVLFTEISASFWGYPGQVLRTFAIGAEPTPLYRELHLAAELAFKAISQRLKPGVSVREVNDAAALIWDAGFTVYDDLLHGFDGGYLPPVVSRPGRPSEPSNDFIFKAGMTVVVQPNVITIDEMAGVQTGELVLVTEAGGQSLHSAEKGFIRVAQDR